MQTSPISFVATKEIGDVCTQATFCLYGDVLRDGIHNDDLQPNRSLQHCCGIVSNYMSPNLAELKIVVVNPVE